VNGRTELGAFGAEAAEVRGRRLDAADAQHLIAVALEAEPAADAAVGADRFPKDLQYSSSGSARTDNPCHRRWPSARRYSYGRARWRRGHACLPVGGSERKSATCAPRSKRGLVAGIKPLQIRGLWTFVCSADLTGHSWDLRSNLAAMLESAASSPIRQLEIHRVASAGAATCHLVPLQRVFKTEIDSVLMFILRCICNKNDPATETIMFANNSTRLDATLTLVNLVEIYSVSKRTIWRWVAEGKIPRPYALSRRIRRWKANEIQQHLDGLPRTSCVSERKA
jgi:predicted DNA-binding transcriptional regulator AlpA